MMTSIICHPPGRRYSNKRAAPVIDVLVGTLCSGFGAAVQNAELPVRGAAMVIQAA